MNLKRLAVNFVLAIIAGLFAYMLWQTIRRPIDFKDIRKKRSDEVHNKLLEIAQLQKMYKDLKGNYATSFDSLKLVLSTGTFRIERVLGDKYDSTQVVKVDTVEIPTIDSMRTFIKNAGKNMDLDAYFIDIAKVPYTDTARFSIKAGMAAVEGMDSLMQPSFEVLTPISAYMMDFPEKDYQIYDPNYKHSNVDKVGDINKPNKLSGNW